MASTKFSEEDPRTDVDEFTVSAIVGGSTDTNIVTAPSDAKPQQKPPQEQQLSNFQQHLLIDNNNLLNSNQDNNTSSAIVVSNGHQFSAISDPNNALNEQNEKKSNNDVNINYNTSDSEPPVLANFGNLNYTF